MSTSAFLQEYAARRANTLATAFLTRRPDVRIHDFESEELEFIVTLDPEPDSKVRGFMQFGVAVKGTDREVASPVAAGKLVQVQRWWPPSPGRKGATAISYYLPVLSLLFSMRGDAGYFSWLARPYLMDGQPFIIMQDEPSFAPIRPESLDEIVAEVRSWYGRLGDVVYFHE